MFKFILALILLTISTSAGLKAQSLNCEKFKNGTFTITIKEVSKTIKRSGDLQTEYYNGGKDKAYFTIIWTDSCTYTLTPHEDFFMKFPNTPRNMLLTVKIIKTTDKSYTQVSSSNISDFVQTGEVVKPGK